jgi:BirA family transcriptional regulator, biotin operon repressor / biotin---[acetyl-CoA-carboxylase] ligase
MFTGMPEGGAIPDASDGGRDEAAASGDRAAAALGGTRFADVRWSAATGSTNADALALARDGAPEGIVVVADHQSAGRGRRDRTWVAPPRGSLLVSVLLRPPARVAGAASLAAAVAMVEAVERVAGVIPGIKWPNDLVVATADGDRKLAGLLAEADWPAGSTISGGYRTPAAHDRAVVVVGVGLNVSWPVMADDPGDGDAAIEPALAEVAGLATALNWLGAEVDRVELLVAFLHGLEDRYAALVSDGPDDLLAAWRERSATLGRRVRVDLGAEEVEGTAVDVTADGHLVVETADGDRRVLAVGDVVHLRSG